MDISYNHEKLKFNYRVSGIALFNDSVLIMKDDNRPYFYLPGGKVKFGETAEEALLRELNEELGVIPIIIRPIWLNQSFFIEETNKLNYHEICIYYLIKFDDPIITNNKELFTSEKNGKSNFFKWVDFKELQDIKIRPEFLKKQLNIIPENFSIITSYYL